MLTIARAAAFFVLSVSVRGVAQDVAGKWGMSFLQRSFGGKMVPFDTVPEL